MKHQHNSDLIFDRDILPVCEPTIRSVAHKYRSLPTEDALIAGKHGLVKGLRSYDPKKGPPRPYLRCCIQREIRDAYFEHHGIAKGYRSVIARIHEAQKDLRFHGYEYPTNQQVADYLAIDIEFINALIGSMHPVCLEYDGEDGESFTPEPVEAVMQTLQHPQFANPVSQLMRAELRRDLDRSLLSAFRKRFGNNPNDKRARQWHAIFMNLCFADKTQQQVADQIHLSREQVNRIYNQIRVAQSSHAESYLHQQNAWPNCWVCFWLRDLEERGWTLTEITNCR